VCLDTLPKVNLTWYDNDTQMSGISSCVLGDTFLPPTPDPRPGYVFTGWKIKPREKCGIDSLVDVGVDVTSTGYAQLDGSTGENESNYGLTTAGQWAVESSYGTVYGMANCNSVKGTAGKVGLPDTATSGRYCWCQVTGFTASGNSYTSGPRCTTYISSSWMYVSSSSNCMSTCASTCRTNFSNNASYRTAMFNAVGQ
jgi:hypothetical protein